MKSSSQPQLTVSVIFLLELTIIVDLLESAGNNENLHPANVPGIRNGYKFV